MVLNKFRPQIIVSWKVFLKMFLKEIRVRNYENIETRFIIFFQIGIGTFKLHLDISLTD